jgi:hypothetical protein
MQASTIPGIHCLILVKASRLDACHRLSQSCVSRGLVCVDWSAWSATLPATADADGAWRRLHAAATFAYDCHLGATAVQ